MLLTEPLHLCIYSRNHFAASKSRLIEITDFNLYARPRWSSAEWRILVAIVVGRKEHWYTLVRTGWQEAVVTHRQDDGRIHYRTARSPSRRVNSRTTRPSSPRIVNCDESQHPDRPYADRTLLPRCDRSRLAREPLESNLDRSVIFMWRKIQKLAFSNFSTLSLERDHSVPLCTSGTSIKAKITSNFFILISKQKVQSIHPHVLNMWMIFSKYYKFCTVKYIFSECIEFHLYIFFVKNSITNINSNISILFICCASIRVYK